MRRMIVDIAIVGSLVVIPSMLITSQLTEVRNEVQVFRVEVQALRGQILDLQEKPQQPPAVILYNSNEKLSLSQKEIDCLSKNIYHEAGVESISGKIAVAQVTHNRLLSGRWGRDICSVVYAKAQFSWTLDRQKRTEQPKGQLWLESQQAARKFITGLRVKNLERSTHYHADYIEIPRWAVSTKIVHKIGQHVFYSTL
jgi:spore germination cell wall hydrolase CwlJ-like protein